jgi:hypothetical protein
MGGNILCRGIDAVWEMFEIWEISNCKFSENQTFEMAVTDIFGH